MYDAISKLRSEMDQNKTNHYVQVVGEYLINYINAHPEAGVKIMVAGKTIGKSLDVMKAEARKNQVNGCGMFTPDEGFAIVMKYFDIAGSAPVIQPAPATVQSTVTHLAPAAPTVKPQFDLKLEDLL